MSVPSPPVIQPRPRSRDETLTFYWTTPLSDGGSPITGYTLTCAAASFSQSYGASTYSATATGLTNATAYTFLIVATNTNGNSDTASFNPCQPGLLAPAPPTAAAAPLDSSGNYLISWTLPTVTGNMATINRFFVEAYDLSSNSLAVAKSTYGDQTQRYLPSVNAAHGHEFRVYSVNDNGYSPYTIALSGPVISLTASSYSGSGAWLDTTGNGFNATLENGTIAKNGAGNGIVLNGSTSWNFPDVNVGTAWTAIVWFKQTNTPTGNGAQILTRSYPNGDINMFIGYVVSSTTDVVGGFFLGGYGAIITTIPYYNFTSNVWTNLAITLNGSTLNIYVNGTYYGTTAYSAVDSPGPYFIGRSTWSDYGIQYVIGEIGEVEIYRRPLSSGEILGHYNTTSSTYSV